MSDGDFGGDGGGGDDGGSDNERAMQPSSGGPAKRSGCLLPALFIALALLAFLAL